jgi:predicted dehydrogenase
VAALAARGERVALAAVADDDLARARRLGSELQTAAFGDARQAFRGVDAAIVAAPTRAHFQLVLTALAHGLDVLVEKPMAASLAEAEAMLGLAIQGGRVLQVGHLEWFNPALRELRGKIGEPRYVEAHRIGFFPDRGSDVDVVRDLMIHDLDIVQQILGEEPERVDAVGIALATEHADLANAQLSFPSGCIANLTASRVSRTAVRRIRFFQRDGCVAIDFLARSAALLQLSAAEPCSPPHLACELLHEGAGDPLLAQLEEFVSAIRTRQAPVVSGQEGLRALRTALRVLEAMPRFGDPD